MGKLNAFTKKVLASVLAAALSIGMVTSVSAEPSAANRVETPQAERAIEHVRVLSEEIGVRPSGLENEWKTAAYIKGELDKLGYETEYQKFPVADQYIGNLSFADGKSWQAGASPSALISDTPVTGEVVYVAGGTKPEEMPSDVSGKIVLMERASSTLNYNLQIENAIAKGAKGVLLQSLVGSRGNYGQAFNPYILNASKKYNVPVYGLAYIQGVWLKEKLAKGSVSINLTAKHHTNLQSVNVIAKKAPKKPNPNTKAAVISAHFDSVVGAPGANDNASGVGLLLELARVYKDVKTDEEIRFLAFGSEERGLLGSQYYVDQLSKTEREKILGVFNADMVATSYDKAKNLYAMTPDGSRNIVTDSAMTAGRVLKNQDILPGTFGSSDHVPFHRAGIPAALFIWMGVDSWSPLVYHIEKVYHTPQDTIAENVSAARMQSALDVIWFGFRSAMERTDSSAKKAA